MPSARHDRPGSRGERASGCGEHVCGRCERASGCGEHVCGGGERASGGGEHARDGAQASPYSPWLASQGNGDRRASAAGRRDGPGRGDRLSQLPRTQRCMCGRPQPFACEGAKPRAAAAWSGRGSARAAWVAALRWAKIRRRPARASQGRAASTTCEPRRRSSSRRRDCAYLSGKRLPGGRGGRPRTQAQPPGGDHLAAARRRSRGLSQARDRLRRVVSRPGSWRRLP